MVKINGMNDVARMAYKGSQNAVKREVITEEKLLGKPAKELFEKAEYMISEAFWNDPHNVAWYAKGLYMANPSKTKNGIDVIFVNRKPVAEINKMEYPDGSIDVCVDDKLSNIRTFLSDYFPSRNPKLRSKKIEIEENVMQLGTGKYFKCRELTEQEKHLREMRMKAFVD